MNQNFRYYIYKNHDTNFVKKRLESADVKRIHALVLFGEWRNNTLTTQQPYTHSPIC